MWGCKQHGIGWGCSCLLKLTHIMTPHALDIELGTEHYVLMKNLSLEILCLNIWSPNWCHCFGRLWNL